MLHNEMPEVSSPLILDLENCQLDQIRRIKFEGFGLLMVYHRWTDGKPKLTLELSVHPTITPNRQELSTELITVG